MITSFSHIVYVRHPNVKNMSPGTIYICAHDHTASWLCPCGCGRIVKFKIAKCKVFDPYDRYTIPDGAAGYELSEDGDISFTSAFVDPDCPNNLVYGIEHNKVILHP